MPFVSSLRHFDHHWYEWTPADPKYEAIEAMVADLPGAQHFVLVFKTERQPPKRQVFFVNDRAAAAHGFGSYRDIVYATKGARGMPQSLHVAFQDEAGRTIDWQIAFAPSTRLVLVNDGLTDQNAHNADAFFMLFFREKQAQTFANRLVVGSRNESLSARDVARVPFAPAYSANVYVATLRYLRGEATMTRGVMTLAGMRYVRHARGQQTVWDANVFPRQRVELIFQGGALTNVTQTSFAHAFTMTFSPGLTFETKAASSRYSAAFDTHENLLTGTIDERRTGDRVALTWRSVTPRWASRTRLRTTFVRQSGAYGYAFGPLSR